MYLNIFMYQTVDILEIENVPIVCFFIRNKIFKTQKMFNEMVKDIVTILASKT